jgi:glycosyltransferase involved in cell wall biosynthesis
MLCRVMHEPRLSVLIPVFNGEAYLAECLDSILAQDFSDWEVIAIDDCSTDGSPAILQRYAERDQRIHWQRNPANRGIGGNFNACLEAARSQNVKYLLQDDKLLDPSALRRLLAVLEKDPAVSLVVSAANLIDEGSKVIEFRDFFQKSGVQEGKPVIVRCLNENQNLIGEPSLAMFRKSQAARGFDVRFHQLLDLEMWFHLLEQGRFAYLAEPLCAFRVHPAQQTEVNRRSGVSEGEPLKLAALYYGRPWIAGVVRPMPLFRRLYGLKKQYGTEAAPLISAMSHALGPTRYAACWIAYKLSRPFQHLWRWVRKNAAGTSLRPSRTPHLCPRCASPEEKPPGGC